MPRQLNEGMKSFVGKDTSSVRLLVVYQLAAVILSQSAVFRMQAQFDSHIDVCCFLRQLIF